MTTRGSTINIQDSVFRSVIREFEAKTGGQLFGPVSSGCKREFYCLNPRNWVWIEEWQDEAGTRRQRKTRYVVLDDRIVKTTDGESYRLVGVDEAKNLLKAAAKYQTAIRARLYLPILNTFDL